MDIAFPHHFVSLILSVMSLLFGAKSHYCSQSLGEVEKKEIVLTKKAARASFFACFGHKPILSCVFDRREHFPENLFGACICRIHFHFLESKRALDTR